MANVTAGTEKTKIYETVLCSPGLDEKCKLSLQVSRLTIVLLCGLIEGGLNNQNAPDDLIHLVPEETVKELHGLVPELLTKGKLTGFYEKLKAI